MKEGSFAILGRELDTLSGCDVCFAVRRWWWPSSSHELSCSARPQAWMLCSETRICCSAFIPHLPHPPPTLHILARAVACSPASFPPHPSVHSAGCCHQQLCFLPKRKVSSRHWSYRLGGWQGKSYRTVPWDAAPGHTCELPEWAWLSPLPCPTLIHSQSFSLVSTWRRQHRSPTASEKADRKSPHSTEEKTKA